MLKQQLFWLLYGGILIAALVLGYQAWQNSRQASIVIEWTTASELDTAGFNLYRSESPGGPFMRLTPTLIPASPDPLTGGSYKYVDRDVVPGHTYYYQLEDVEINGGMNRSADTVQQKAEGGGWIEMVLSILLAGVGLTGIANLILQHRKREAR